MDPQLAVLLFFTLSTADETTAAQQLKPNGRSTTALLIDNLGGVVRPARRSVLAARAVGHAIDDLDICALGGGQVQGVDREGAGLARRRELQTTTALF